MAVSYNGLWKLLIDKNLKKVDLTNKYGISSSTIAKMSKGKTVSMDIMERLCKELDCDFGDIIHYVRDKDGENSDWNKKDYSWLYSGKQNGFKELIYMHHYDADTVGRVELSA